MAMAAEAERYKSRGVDVVDFSVGEPDFPTPEHIKRGAIHALEQNLTKYTAAGGIMPLRQAICDWHRAQLGTNYEAKECVVSVGGKHAIFNAVSVLVNSGDEVLIPSPCWVSFPDIVKYAGGKPVALQTLASENFALRASAVEAAITPRTRMVIVNSPSNPTGAVVPDEEFARILDVCQRRGVWLLSDECYSHFLYDGARPFSIGSVPVENKDKLIVIGSFSKTFAMTGWRLGYALAPELLVKAMIKLQSQSTSNPTSIAQYAGLEAMRGSMDTVAVMLAEYARRRARVMAGLRAIPGVVCSEPAGAFYAFPNVSGAARQGGAIPAAANEKGNAAGVAKGGVAQDLLERVHVAVVPGEAFGAPGHLRISYATSMDRIDEGLRRLAQFFSAAAAA
ncbi:MAG: pyridoxal phosphate-dependent aminotransferase [Acidipila sp.]|nr:pyridoxal phosphate-dependent aminotransferase [Acidipila sp.]